MTPDHGPRPEPDLNIPFLGRGQTLVIRNEVSLKLVRFDRVLTGNGLRMHPWVKIFAPEEYDIYAFRDGVERRMHSVVEGDGFSTTAVRLSPDRSRLNLGR